jgi:hypothetical protein
MSSDRPAEARAKAALVDWVYRWWKHGGGRLMDEKGVVTNIGMCGGTEKSCAELAELRRAIRKGKT